MKPKLAPLIFLLLVIKRSRGAIWTPFYSGIESLVQSTENAKGYLATASLCLAFMEAKIKANVVCYREEDHLCHGYKVDLSLSGSDDKLDAWNCFKVTCPYSLWDSKIISEVLESVTVSADEATLHEGDSLCPSGSVRFAPCNFEQFEMMRLNLIAKKAANVDLPSNLQIGIKLNIDSQKWHNIEFGDFLFDNPTCCGVYPFFRNDPDNDSECARLLNDEFLLADRKCSYEWQALCVKSFGL